MGVPPGIHPSVRGLTHEHHTGGYGVLGHRTKKQFRASTNRSRFLYNCSPARGVVLRLWNVLIAQEDSSGMKDFSSMLNKTYYIIFSIICSGTRGRCPSPLGYNSWDNKEIKLPAQGKVLVVCHSTGGSHREWAFKGPYTGPFLNLPL